MTHETVLTLLICAPLIGAFVLPLVGLLSESLRNALALAMVGVSFVCAALLVPAVTAGASVAVRLPLAVGETLFYADGLAVFMALVSTSVGAVIVFYSFGYIRHYENRNEYYCMVVLFLGSMMGLVFSRNLIYLFLFWEITAFTCWRLIGFFREPKIVLRADKAFLVTVFGALVMLVGFLEVYAEAGSFDLGLIKAALAGRPVSNLAVILILFGILSKSATLPLHTWLPDAGVAPSPVTALLHAAVLVKIGVYVFARLFVMTMGLDAIWHTVVPIIAAASALVSAGAAFVETDMKRIIAYSTVSQLAFILLGLSAGTLTGFSGGLLYILMHGIAKGGLFLCAGIVEHGTHTKDITKMGGLIRSMPLTAIAFLLCSFSVMGIPPFGGFFAKYLVIAGAAESGQVALTLVFGLGAAMTILYLFRLFTAVFMGEEKIAAPRAQLALREGSASMVGSVVLLAALSLASGFLVAFPSGFVQGAIVAFAGGLR
jgi:NADH:ubiquinone oxidoreductase subunit 5 (subunit L)/multisubunit Na+/H+ antiporter MnhA subunit